MIRVDHKGGHASPSETVIRMRCPGCSHKGVTEQIGVQDVNIGELNAKRALRCGIRRCADPACGTVIFFISDWVTKETLVTFPTERLDFDATNVPATVSGALEEAITCHAHQCHIASAIMVRKTLEELCADQLATGKNLKDRLKALSTKIVVPQDLIEGLDDLRMLGNDAAHIESKEFNQIGAEEVEVGIEFTKELLKATYQYSTLLSRLRALKK